MRKTYRGERIEVSFDLDRCIHIGECLRGHPDVFDAGRRPWILADAAEPDAVAEVVRRCPSGALQYERLDGGPQEEHAETTITPLRDGPLLVTGEIRITHPDGTIETTPRATLCRCGHSGQKPFCDNQHLVVGFRAPGQSIKIHLTPVRPRELEPVAKENDPRRHG